MICVSDSARGYVDRVVSVDVLESVSEDLSEKVGGGSRGYPLTTIPNDQILLHLHDPMTTSLLSVSGAFPGENGHMGRGL